MPVYNVFRTDDNLNQNDGVVAYIDNAEDDADPSVDSTFVVQSVTCQPVLQVVKEFRGESATGREEIGPVFVKSNLDVLLLPLWHIKNQILD